jgi:azobenzene reductase
VRVVCISGSPNPTAWSRALLGEVVGILEQRGCVVDLADLRELALPMVDVRAYHAEGPYAHPAGRALRARVAAADAVVLATPVHHSSYAGVLKNALDHLSGDAFEGRAVGLLSNGGAAHSATIACEHLRSVVKAMGGWAVPTQVATSEDDFDPQTRRLVGRVPRRRCEALCDELLLFTRAMVGLRAVAQRDGAR